MTRRIDAATLMNNQRAKNLSPLPSHFFGLWSDYWENQGFLTPPIHFYRETMSNGALLVSPVGDVQIKDFIKSQKDNKNYYFAPQGQSLLDERKWLGHWSSISIDLASPVLLPPVEPLNNRVPGTEGWV